MTWRIGGANTNETFAGVIDNCASSTNSKYNGTTTIYKVGSGDWKLTGANIYSGKTYVEGGRLIVNGSHTGGGYYYVRDGATLAGRGSVGSKVLVSSGGEVFAGDGVALSNSYILKLTAGLTLNSGANAAFQLKYNGTSTICPKIAVTGAFVVNDATLVLDTENITEEMPDGTEFKLFSSLGSVTGTGFSTIIPERPSPTQLWDTSTLLTDGILRVKADPTAINTITADSNSLSDVWYNLQGQRVSNPSHGIFINKNGKKVILK